MKSTHKIFLAISIIALIATASILLVAGYRTYPERTLNEPLSEVLPTGETDGWQYEDLPLGNTESMQEASERILNLSDYIYRRYTKGADSFEVYVAYWEAGKMSPRLMNGHTPDTCWVTAGWSKNVISDSEEVVLEDIRLVPGLSRWFRQKDAKINVIFWHLVDGESYRYGHQTFGQRLKRLVSDPFVRGLGSDNEQYLIRISSYQTLERVEGTALFSDICNALRATGLVQTKAVETR